MRNRILWALAALLVVVALQTTPSRAETAADPQAFIADLAKTAISTVADKQIADTERRERFRRLFVSSFDLPDIGRFVLARFWRTASPDQQQQFLKLFEDIEVLTWSQRFKDYNGESLQTLSTNIDADRGWVVDSQLVRVGQPAIPLQWKVHRAEDGSLKVVDIVVEGVSMALTQRQDYASVLQNGGGKLDSLFPILHNKIVDMGGS
jgi:phospholipid transport system substrate-binding protein